jgi:hypothetical protein
MPGLDSDGRFKPTNDWSNRTDDGVHSVLTRGAIDMLPAEYRTALVLDDVQYLSRPEVADHPR